MRYLLIPILIISLNYSVLSQKIATGASRTSDYLHLLKNKKVALVANATSMVGNRHLVDTLVSSGVKVSLIFGPEHGFRGNADAGEKIENSIDKVTGIKVVSLYGKHSKPTRTDLAGIDVVVFDIQDVGVRFYTYISTMHYVMEACAEDSIPFIVFDRPNPNGYYVDGPVLDLKFTSFVGMHPVALVHGMTVGEYARMINGEGWLAGGKKVQLTVISCKGYTHSSRYELPVKPSPNLPNARSIELYPSLGFTEGTVMSCGRGTDFPFQVIGHPAFTATGFTFTPRSIPGASKTPPLMGQSCNAIDLRTNSSYPDYIPGKVNISLIIKAFKGTKLGTDEQFFNQFFNKLAGNDILQNQIKSGIPESEIRKSWQPALDTFKSIRKKHLLYDDFK